MGWFDFFSSKKNEALEVPEEAIQPPVGHFTTKERWMTGALQTRRNNIFNRRLPLYFVFDEDWPYLLNEEGSAKYKQGMSIDMRNILASYRVKGRAGEPEYPVLPNATTRSNSNTITQYLKIFLFNQYTKDERAKTKANRIAEAELAEAERVRNLARSQKRPDYFVYGGRRRKTHRKKTHKRRN
jgi:hypothetical protein